MHTIYDIAKKTGYSPATISKAFNNYSDINEKTKNTILQVAKEMGYTPNLNARELTTKKGKTIGVLSTHNFGLGFKHAFFTEIVLSFKNQIEEEGYELIFLTQNLGKKKMTYYEHCLYRGIQAFFMIDGDINYPEIQEIINSDIYCVSADLIHPKVYSVLSDNQAGTMEAMNYLISNGHKRIAHITRPFSIVASMERYNSYKDSLKNAKIEFNPDYVVEADYHDLKAGYEAMKKLLALKKLPTAVFTFNDDIAIGAIKAVRDNGLNVPDDISFIGFDNIDIASYSYPSLTTVQQDRIKIGQISAQKILNAIKNNVFEYGETRIPTKLFIRNSVASI